MLDNLSSNKVKGVRQRIEKCGAEPWGSWTVHPGADRQVLKPETTGKFVAATFEHDTGRPVDGYAAPQLHTHAVIFNVTERDGGYAKLKRTLQSHAVRPLRSM